jgi:hypothetical protein
MKQVHGGQVLGSALIPKTTSKGIFSFLKVLEFELGASQLLGRTSFCLSHSTSPFFVCDGFFEIGSCELFAWWWLQTVILVISASQVARITGMSPQCLYGEFLCGCINGKMPPLLLFSDIMKEKGV